MSEHNTDSVEVTFEVSYGQTKIKSVEPQGTEDNDEVVVDRSIYYQLEDLGIAPRGYSIVPKDS